MELSYQKQLLSCHSSVRKENLSCAVKKIGNIAVTPLSLGKSSAYLPKSLSHFSAVWKGVMRKGNLCIIILRPALWYFWQIYWDTGKRQALWFLSETNAYLELVVTFGPGPYGTIWITHNGGSSYSTTRIKKILDISCPARHPMTVSAIWLKRNSYLESMTSKQKNVKRWSKWNMHEPTLTPIWMGGGAVLFTGHKECKFFPLPSSKFLHFSSL